jgi:Sec-independent protein translocase protein TatA
MELLAAVVSIITLSFFVTVIAVVAIVFGQQKVVGQAVETLGGNLKTALKSRVKEALQKARGTAGQPETETPPPARKPMTWVHGKRRIEHFSSEKRAVGGKRKSSQQGS